MRITLCFIACFMMNVLAHAQSKTITYQDGAQKLNGELTVPARQTGRKSGVLILPAWMGIDEHSKTVAKQLSDQGYYTFIADIYGEGKYPKDAKEAGERSGYYKKNVTEYQKRIMLAIQQLIKGGAHPNEIVVIGYCFGGLGALEAARMNMPVRGVVSFHGSYTRDETRAIQPIRPRILILHGAEDHFSTGEDIVALQDELRAARADWQMNYYSDAVHGFTDPKAGDDKTKGVAYNEKADKRSWQELMVFLRDIFQNPGH